MSGAMRLEALSLLYPALWTAAWVAGSVTALAGLFTVWAGVIDRYGLWAGSTWAAFCLWGLVEMGYVAWKHRSEVRLLG